MDADIIDLDDDVPGDKYDAEADTELQSIEEELAQVSNHAVRHYSLNPKIWKIVGK